MPTDKPNIFSPIKITAAKRTGFAQDSPHALAGESRIQFSPLTPRQELTEGPAPGGGNKKERGERNQADHPQQKLLKAYHTGTLSAIYRYLGNQVNNLTTLPESRDPLFRAKGRGR